MGDKAPWKVSQHGGHSGQFCDHAEGTLRSLLEAAVAFGYTTFGVTEHAPRLGERFLYENERALGWDVEKIRADFERYGTTVPKLAEEFSDRLEVLRGFEAEVVPSDRYVEIMQGYREQFRFDYCVGSVHYVDELAIDGPLREFEEAVTHCGGLEKLAVRYYETVAGMAQALQPEVIGHLDLIQKHPGPDVRLDTPPIREAAIGALEAIARIGAILDINTAGYRKGLGRPYPDAWLLHEAQLRGIGVCFGDDSHRPGEVGMDLGPARSYLLENGFGSITRLTRGTRGVEKQVVSLHPQSEPAVPSQPSSSGQWRS